jgi:heptosyltransferase III
MSVSKNILTEKKDLYIKKYKYKKPLIKFIFRSLLDLIGIKQPVEYYNNFKRMEFEYKVLSLWQKYNLNVPTVLKKENNTLYLSKIEGYTVEELLKKSFNLELIEKIFIDLESRHTLAKKEKQVLFCHIDSNLRNIIYSNNNVFHLDFEMGREYEKLEIWMEREISKLLYSLLHKENRENRDLILTKFIEIYSHKEIITNLIDKKLKNRIINNRKYTLANLLYELNDILNIDKKIELKSNINNILVIYSARFGDILLSTPLIRLLKEKWPNSEITYLTHPKRFEILLNNDFIDNVGTITSNKMSIKNITYDLSIILNNNAESFVNQALNISTNVIAFRTGNYDLDSKLLYTRRYPRQHSLHSVDMRLSLFNTLSNNLSSKKLLYTITDDENNFAIKYLQKVGIENKFLIGIQSSSFHTKAYRNWSIDNFIELCKKIDKKYKNVYFLLLGSKDDLPNIEEINNKINNSIIIAGEVSLRESAALMNKLNLYIGVDTGPTHIIGTMHIPMIVIYHSFASSKLLMPLENNNFIAVDHPIKEHGNEKTSINDISVCEVFEKVEKIMDKGGLK